MTVKENVRYKMKSKKKSDKTIYENRIVRTAYMFAVPFLILSLLGMDIETMKSMNLLALMVIGALYFGFIAD